MSFHFIYLFIFLFFNAFPPKIILGPCQGGGGGGGCSFVGMVTGPKSNVQWAKKWCTVGQNLTYAGLKSDVRAKKLRWGVVMQN